MRQKDREQLAQSLGQFRRVIWREMILNMSRTFAGFDFSLIHLTALLLLEEEGELSIKRIAELLERSVSATSRLLDQLVERGWVSRREDERDRRIKRVSITDEGRAFFSTLEQRRAAAQLAVMEYLSAEEQEIVLHAMMLLAEGGERRRSHEHSASRSEER